MASAQTPPPFLNLRERALLEAGVARIERRRLRWVWKTDPTLPGSTIALQPQDLARAEAWLRDIRETRTRLADGACARSMLVAAALCLSRRYDEETAFLKVKRALQDEELWRSKSHQAA